VQLSEDQLVEIADGDVAVARNADEFVVAD